MNNKKNQAANLIIKMSFADKTGHFCAYDSVRDLCQSVCLCIHMHICTVLMH